MTNEPFWQVGREPGRQVVALGAALTLTAVSLDVLLAGTLTLFFDLCFMALCLGLAALVRRRDFFLVALLPPLLMTGVFTFLALVARDTVPAPPLVDSLEETARGLAIQQIIDAIGSE